VCVNVVSFEAKLDRNNKFQSNSPRAVFMTMGSVILL